MTTTTPEMDASTAEMISEASFKKFDAWTVESLTAFLKKYNWRLDAMEHLIEKELIEDEDEDGSLTSDMLHGIAVEFWANTPRVRPNAERLVSLAGENNFDDDYMFYKQGNEWIESTHKDYQTKFLWTFMAYGFPCELNSMVVTLMDSEDLYVSSLASIVRAGEQLKTGNLVTEGGSACLESAYEALTNKEFIIRLKQARMLTSKVATLMRGIEAEILDWDYFTEKQKLFLSKFLRSEGI